MKEKLRISLLGIFAFSILLMACDASWIPDPIDPRLPMYTENGINTAGAIVNGELWRSRVDQQIFGSINATPYVDFTTNKDSLVIIFLGDSKNLPVREITFTIKNENIQNAADFLKLRGRVIPLDGLQNTVSVFDYYNDDCNSSGIGQIYFRNVKFGGENGTSILFSGTFSFIQDDPVCANYDVSYGRFDYRIE